MSTSNSVAALSSAERSVPTSVLVLFCFGDLGRAVLSGLITSYLMVVYIPQSTSSLPILLPAAAVTFAVVRGIGSVLDAVIDPVIAYFSDRSNHRSGRRSPFMRWSVVPWAASTVLLVLAPAGEASWVNSVWVAVFLLINLVASSVYNVPYFALQAELVTEQRRRVWFFTINTLFFVIGSAVVFLSPVIKGLFFASGVSELLAWQLTFGVFTAIGFVFVLVPAFAVRERKWVDFEPAYIPLLSSFLATLRYPNFVILLAAYLVMWIAFALFNAALLYYVTMLIGAPESFSTVVAVLTILVGVASYWPINLLARRVGKKPLMAGACIAYVVIYAAIYQYEAVLTVLPGTAFAVLIGVLIGFPISVTNILPPAAFADLTQYDTIRTGINRAGMFFASRNFITSLSQSVVLFVTPTLISIGSADGRATEFGVRLSAGVAAVTIAVACVLYFFYDDRHVTRVLAEHERSENNTVES